MVNLLPAVSQTRHLGDSVVACADCGKPCQSSGCGTGYAELADEGWRKRVCYSCAGERERQRMKESTSLFAYLSGDGKAITTWSGERLAIVRHESQLRSGFGGRQTFVRALDANGTVWYGRNGGRGMYIHLRRTKGD